MHITESALENKTHKLLWDFEIQTNHLISARRSDLVIVNKIKRTWWIVDVALPANHSVNQKEREKGDEFLELARKLKKVWNMKVTVISIVIGALGRVSHPWMTVPSTGTRGLENKGKIGDHPNYSIIKIAQNTEKNPGDFMRLDVTQIPLRNHRLNLLLKLSKSKVGMYFPLLIVKCYIIF